MRVMDKFPLKFTKTLHDEEHWVEYVCFSPDEKLIASCSGNFVTLWDVKHLKKEAIFKHSDAVWKCTFSKNSLVLLTVSSDGCLYKWNIGKENRSSSLVVKLHNDCVFGLSLHPVLNLVACCSADNKIKCLDLDTEEVTSTLQGHSKSVEDVCFSPSGNLLASCSKDKNVLLWTDFLNENNLKAHCLKGHRNWVYMCRFAPNEKLLASTSSDRTICIWSVEKPTLLKILRGHSNVIWSCVFITSKVPLGCLYLASCSSDKTVR